MSTLKTKGKIVKQEKKEKVIKLVLLFSRCISTRESARALIKMIKQLPEKLIVVDFKNIDMITRSFAHEYLTNKKSLTKKIVEKNLVEDVKKMLEIIQKQASVSKKNKEQIKIMLWKEPDEEISSEIMVTS